MLVMAIIPSPVVLHNEPAPEPHRNHSHTQACKTPDPRQSIHRRCKAWDPSGRDSYILTLKLYMKYNKKGDLCQVPF